MTTSSSTKSHIGIHFELLNSLPTPLTVANAMLILNDASANLVHKLKSLEYWPRLHADGEVSGQPYTYMGVLGLPEDDDDFFTKHSVWFDSPVEVPREHLLDFKKLTMTALHEAAAREHVQVVFSRMVLSQEKTAFTHTEIDL